MKNNANTTDDSADCEDQGLAPTTRCTKWNCRDPRCRGPELVRDWRGNWVCPNYRSWHGNWVHPNCRASYGKDAKG